VAVGLTNCAADNAQLIPMVEATQAVVGELPQQVLADAGYRSEENFVQVEAKNIDAVIALGREGKQQQRHRPHLRIRPPSG
jgi:galactokinase